MIQTEPGTNEQAAGLSQPETEVSLLGIVALLAGHKRFLARFVVGAALLATVLAFVLPVRYEGKIVLLPPTQSSSIASALLGQISNLGGLGSLAVIWRNAG